MHIYHTATATAAVAGKGWNWYKGLIFGAKTKMNMYFYGTLLDKTQKDEPAGRSIHQVCPVTHTHTYTQRPLSALLFPQPTHSDDPPPTPHPVDSKNTTRT